MTDRGALVDDVAVITGAASGNGRAIALQYAAEGADVVVADVREDPREGGEPTHERIEAETDRRAEYVECDVTERADLEAAAAAAEAMGGLDVWVNNAGVFRSEEFLDVSADEFDWLFDVNAKGPFFGSQVAAARMIEAGSGAIVNISSGAGLYGSADYVTYCMSKAAVHLLTTSLAAKLGPAGIRVNSVHPGVIETSMTTEDVPIVGGEGAEAYRESIPSRRFGTPEDVAGVATFLASGNASYVNGEAVVVDGGYTSTL